MEGGDQSVGNGGSRWNPTKEQINMLESLYKQDLRTPTPEQIQQITARLRDFGHIEGKNVFYWFQNHKARQRQKQKQDSFAYYNRFLHPTPLFPSYPNVVCSPCYIAPPKSDAVYYHQYPKVPLSIAGGSFKRSRLIPDQSINDQRYYKKQEMRQETLDLFPIHPTGILQSRNGNPNSCSNNDPNSTDQNGRVHANHGCDGDEDEDDGHPFFDFFCGNS